MIIKNRMSERVEIGDINNSGEKWTGTGLTIIDCNDCDFIIGEVKNFEVGVRMLSQSSPGVAHNRFWIRRLVNNKVNLELVNENTGWVNHNKFYDGRFAHGTRNEPMHPDFTHVKLHTAPNSLHGEPDNNTFDGCSFEGLTAKYMVDITGSYNAFINCRWERNQNKAKELGFKNYWGLHTVRVRGDGENYILGGFDYEKVKVKGSGMRFVGLTLIHRLKRLVRIQQW